MTGTRIDKWLWAARFFKTRQLAAKSCELGRVILNRQIAKPAREVKINDIIQVSTPGGDFEITVLAIEDKRGSAAIAQSLYSESDESKARRKQVSEARRLASQIEVLPDIKPSARDRRALNRLRGRDF